MNMGSTEMCDAPRHTTKEIFSNSSPREDYDEAQKWDSVQRPPQCRGMRTAGLFTYQEDCHSKEVNVKDLVLAERKTVLERLMRTPEEDNFLLKLKERIQRVGMELPMIEVRFERLNVEAEAYVGGRAMPTMLNFCINVYEVMLATASQMNASDVSKSLFHRIRKRNMDFLGDLNRSLFFFPSLLVPKGFLSYLRLIPDKKIAFPILHEVTGIVKPGRMTLLLGPPASGKTTLLLALAGRLSSDLQVSGKITYNGYETHEFVPQRSSAYISQHDLHMGELTVRETLAFSARCQGLGAFHDMLAELLRREKEANIKPDPDLDLIMKSMAIKGQQNNVVTDYIIKILGLEACANTMVGDQMIRGISGGEKKRLTTGELMVGPARVLLMDEISTGLDSSTTFQIVNSIKQSIRILQKTAVISLLQPAPETFKLFDDIILLSDGQIVYQGPRELVLEFFESMGFRCPERKGVADFLQEVTSKKDQEQYWIRRDELYTFVSAKQFSDAFQLFHIGKDLAAVLEIPFDKTRSHPGALTTEKYGVSQKELLKACFAREFLFMKRNSLLYAFRLINAIVIALIAATVFPKTKMHKNSIIDGQLFMAPLFLTVAMLMFNGFTDLALVILKLPIFYKHRDLIFFPSWAYAMPTWILTIPYAVLETGLWLAITYYGIGFDPNVARFWRQYLLLVLINQTASALFRLIAAVGRDMKVANTCGCFALVVILVLGGFILPYGDINKWSSWGYWTSPLMYAQNAISVNEFLGDSWSHLSPGSTEPLGVLVLKSRAISSDMHWYWVGTTALVAFTVLFNFFYTIALTYLNPLKKAPAALSQETLAERISSKTGVAVGLSSKRKDHLSDSGHDDPLRLPSRVASMSNNVTSRKQGMVLPFEPLSVSFDDIRYAIKMPQEMKAQGVPNDRLELLKGVSGCFRPGVLTALMGVTGAGKTTLLDVLAGRKTGGYIEGMISITGSLKKPETFARIEGYCEQNDIHSPHVTVYESLQYSAWLRLPAEVDIATRKIFVEAIMELIELTKIKEALVGLPGVNGLSTEQRRRLTIAVELVANPSIIFMDEPTTGLDARAAAVVMRTIRNTVDIGRTVVCTIHQPSVDVFDAFDELVLLKLGGEQIYAGPLGRHCSQLIEYFEGINGVGKLIPGQNPAAWMMEVSSISQEAALGVDFAAIYKNSEAYKYDVVRNKALIRELSTPATGSKDLHLSAPCSQPFFTQFKACLWKQRLSYWRNTKYTAMRLLFTTAVALVSGTIFWQIGSKRRRLQDLLDAMGSMYASILFIGVSNATAVQSVVDIERTVFYREKAAGMYSALPYALGQVAIELPYILVQTLIYGVIVYAMIGFEWTAAKFFWYIFIIFFTLVYYTAYGMMAVTITPNQNIAAILSSAFYTLWNLFAGFIVPKSRIPVWWRWYYYSCPLAWTLNGLLASQFGDIKELMIDTNSTVEDFISSYFGFRREDLWFVAVIIVGTAALFTFIFAISIKTLNFQKR